MRAEEVSGFDKLAGVYRWLEIFTFGPLLTRCREEYLAEAAGAGRALVMGDGDGRYTAALLRVSASVRVDALDASGAMLQALSRRAVRVRGEGRLCALRVRLPGTMPDGPYDLVATHFFLDCLTDTELEHLVGDTVRRMGSGGRWIVSEFAVPRGPAGWLGSAVVHGLYRAFGVITGLRVRRLPDYAAIFRKAGLVERRSRPRFFGILRSELWQRPAPAAEPGDR